MPLFPKKKNEKKAKGLGLTEHEEEIAQAPESPYVNQNGGGSSGTPHQAQPPRQARPKATPGNSGGGVYGTAEVPPQVPKKQSELVFHTQLAHGSPTGKIRGFTNVRELYEKIGEAFGMSSKKILFCTLNTHIVDMTRLLGGQIGLEDFIFAHIKGQTDELTFHKSEQALGLTITDNGAGYAFIKRIKENSVMDKDDRINVGDHIEAINGQTMVGARHFEVAQALKKLPVSQNFTMVITQPLKAFTQIQPRSAAKVATAPNDDKVKTGKETLRLRSTGQARVEAIPLEWETRAVKRIDDLLESFMGIRDEELAGTMVDLGKDKKSPIDFQTALDQQLGDFAFPDDIIFDIWGAITDARAGRI
ncbi:PDZ domain-containing protein GIPC1-like [Anneissia japonica]|uniref:PDZ domain-containing protein GIPC1-like n=1 Tax=Anneissia japonica TaxID=1529436 RepID=UPI00142558AE|nr:PDZ domain-containing protein GIPC1-like [Anneissia japonica]